MKKPLVLCILDGFAIREEEKNNAIKAANTPNMDMLMTKYPNILLGASGMDVGLPDGQMGNSEVGHMNIGAGRVVYQSLSLINKSIIDGDFYRNEKFLNCISHVKQNKSKLHVFGLLSDGGVHSHINHIFALLQLAKNEGLDQVYFHAFLDGRDVEPDSGARYMEMLENKMKEIGIGVVATINGRYYGMDRDKNFDRVAKSYDVMVSAKGNSFTDAVAYIKDSYAQNVFDEFVVPAYNATIDGKIEDNDGIIFANYRPDRAIQISSALTNPEYLWVPEVQRKNLYYVCMMKYAESVKGVIAFEPQKLTNILGEVLANNGVSQLRIAETEKYAHVTFFFDGTMNFDGKERPELDKCTRVLIKSPSVATYDLKPEMSAYEVTDALLAELDKNIHDVVILNYANCDMVGHTAIFDAVVKAVETVDTCVGKVYQKVQELGGLMLITADHGNADQVCDDKGNPMTSHTTNPVPFIITDENVKLVEKGKLADIAPTMLNLLGIEVPTEMDGNSLLK